MLDQNNTALMIIDVQGQLAQLMHDRKELFTQLTTMVEGAKLMDLPIIWAEQLPDKLGATIPELHKRLNHIEPIEKDTFSAYQNDSIREALKNTKAKQVLLVGIEAHICVYQTAMDLKNSGYEVHLVTDAISSRCFANKELAIQRLSNEGAKLTCVEMALFELQKIALGPQFKQLLKHIK